VEPARDEHVGEPRTGTQNGVLDAQDFTQPGVITDSMAARHISVRISLTSTSVSSDVLAVRMCKLHLHWIVLRCRFLSRLLLGLYTLASLSDFDASRYWFQVSALASRLIFVCMYQVATTALDVTGEVGSCVQIELTIKLPRNSAMVWIL
jgi:hypothetical protein